jgi:hypothetical protein
MVEDNQQLRPVRQRFRQAVIQLVIISRLGATWQPPLGEGSFDIVALQPNRSESGLKFQELYRAQISL